MSPQKPETPESESSLPPHGGVLLNPRGEIEAIAPDVSALLGEPAENLVGTPFRRFLARPSREALGQLMGRLGRLGRRSAVWSSLWLQVPFGAMRCLVRASSARDDRGASLLRLELRRERAGRMPRNAAPGV